MLGPARDDEHRARGQGDRPFARRRLGVAQRDGQLAVEDEEELVRGRRGRARCARRRPWRSGRRSR